MIFVLSHFNPAAFCSGGRAGEGHLLDLELFPWIEIKGVHVLNERPRLDRLVVQMPLRQFPPGGAEGLEVVCLLGERDARQHLLQVRREATKVEMTQADLTDRHVQQEQRMRQG
jgi:hypothetical protein